MAILEINDASVSFGPVSNRYDVLKDLNLKVEENEFCGNHWLFRGRKIDLDVTAGWPTKSNEW